MTDSDADDIDDLDDLEVVEAYHWVGGSDLSSAFWIMGGIAGCLLAVLGFGLALLLPVNAITLQMVTTVPLLAGLSALFRGLTMTKGPQEVILDGTGLHMRRDAEVTSHAWDDIGWATLTLGNLSQSKILIVYDRSGKQLVKLSASYADFDEMAEHVVDRAGKDAPEIAVKLRRGKARKQGYFLIAGGTLFLALSASVGWMTYDEALGEQLLLTSGVPGEGKIVERKVAPNGRTKRLYYEVTGTNGEAATHNAEVEETYWQQLEGEMTVPIIYVPDDPSRSRLQQGEVDRDKGDFTKTPAGGYLVSGIVALLSVGFIIIGILNLKGWDVDLDSKTKKWSIKRFGDGR